MDPARAKLIFRAQKLRDRQITVTNSMGTIYVDPKCPILHMQLEALREMGAEPGATLQILIEHQKGQP